TRRRPRNGRQNKGVRRRPRAQSAPQAGLERLYAPTTRQRAVTRRESNGGGQGIRRTRVQSSRHLSAHDLVNRGNPCPPVPISRSATGGIWLGGAGPRLPGATGFQGRARRHAPIRDGLEKVWATTVSPGCCRQDEAAGRRSRSGRSPPADE